MHTFVNFNAGSFPRLHVKWDTTKREVSRKRNRTGIVWIEIAKRCTNTFETFNAWRGVEGSTRKSHETWVESGVTHVCPTLLVGAQLAQETSSRHARRKGFAIYTSLKHTHVLHNVYVDSRALARMRINRILRVFHSHVLSVYTRVALHLYRPRRYIRPDKHEPTFPRLLRASKISIISINFFPFTFVRPEHRNVDIVQKLFDSSQNRFVESGRRTNVEERSLTGTWIVSQLNYL